MCLVTDEQLAYGRQQTILFLIGTQMIVQCIIDNFVIVVTVHVIQDCKDITSCFIVVNVSHISRTLNVCAHELVCLVNLVSFIYLVEGCPKCFFFISIS